MRAKTVCVSKMDLIFGSHSKFQLSSQKTMFLVLGGVGLARWGGGPPDQPPHLPLVDQHSLGHPPPCDPH